MPQAWKDAEAHAQAVYERSLSRDERAAASSLDEMLMIRRTSSSSSSSGGGGGGGEGGSGRAATREEGGLVYDLLAVVVHRGSAYSGHYHAFIKDSLQEVSIRLGF